VFLLILLTLFFSKGRPLPVPPQAYLPLFFFWRTCEAPSPPARLLMETPSPRFYQGVLAKRFPPVCRAGPFRFVSSPFPFSDRRTLPHMRSPLSTFRLVPPQRAASFRMLRSSCSRRRPLLPLPPSRCPLRGNGKSLFPFSGVFFFFLLFRLVPSPNAGIHGCRFFLFHAARLSLARSLDGAFHSFISFWFLFKGPSVGGYFLRWLFFL